MRLPRLPVHGKVASLLFREDGSDVSFRLAVTGTRHAVGDRVEVVPGLRVVTTGFLGGCFPDPGEARPAERLWSCVLEGSAGVQPTDGEPERKESVLRKLQRRGSLPVRRRNKKNL